MTLEDKNQSTDHSLKTDSDTEDDNSIGYDGKKKSALDLEIERELLEMMENDDSDEPEKQSKIIKIGTLLSSLVIATFAIVRFIKSVI
ncbi:hypothetical protein E2558_10350 [Staphylococcus pragensis]|uniref:Uncharacterized protein n=1 Tax=Staphylococcus pragensis TaxID=1611836 RepID=A0A4Z1BHJ3_9STAP|nr:MULTISPECIES: hypothetical protein [Staphylococcus]RTX91264.1 hypothetical protein CD154_02470 [Staphylococcus carnosus]TGN24459.1 hypothetical protein E2558_10350 [Staphylococcus pragensis]GGG98739.1 hypothetical protein GCM10007342_23240 [Staphylococcus pragensis]